MRGRRPHLQAASPSPRSVPARTVWAAHLRDGNAGPARRAQILSGRAHQAVAACCRRFATSAWTAAMSSPCTCSTSESSASAGSMPGCE